MDARRPLSLLDGERTAEQGVFDFPTEVEDLAL